MHEIVTFKFFMGLQLQLSGSFEFKWITVTVSLLFSQYAVAGNNTPQNFRILGNYSYMMQWASNLKLNDIERMVF